ncbi:hypothetical protein ACFPH6_13270 [Streptomyces xiangluensis]|uniref:Uncharacterized protein n=1 Tax=Streptomyces xiangluensis TaxID=2665720 RepID=A0ABV8YMM9_9ACTN
MSVHNEHSVLVEAAGDGVGDGVAHADRAGEAGTGGLMVPSLSGKHLGLTAAVKHVADVWWSHEPSGTPITVGRNRSAER